MGELFKRLIQLSPSRSDALERVQQFEQLLNSRTYSYSGSSDEKSTPSQIAVNEAALSFDVDDIDFITSTSFNYGVGRSCVMMSSAVACRMSHTAIPHLKYELTSRLTNLLLI